MAQSFVVDLASNSRQRRNGCCRMVTRAHIASAVRNVATCRTLPLYWRRSRCLHRCPVRTARTRDAQPGVSNANTWHGSRNHAELTIGSLEPRGRRDARFQRQQDQQGLQCAFPCWLLQHQTTLRLDHEQATRLTELQPLRLRQHQKTR